eukprot:gene13629-18289_t
MEDNRSSWSKNINEERHKGSYDIEKLKAEMGEQKLNGLDAACDTAKKKYAICFGYLGTNYQGLQINPGAITLEAELEKALFMSGAIAECNFGHMQKIQWTRAARTDRGVHAAAQCCAMKLILPANGDRNPLLNKLNTLLPKDMRVHKITKVTKSFNSKMHCTKRRYNYLLPTYLLQDSKNTNTIMDGLFAEFNQNIKNNANPSLLLNDENLKIARNNIFTYRTNESQLILLKDCLKVYLGTHSYHNFTSGKTSADANSKRFIISFECSDPFVSSSGVEWLQLSLVGQSFLLNQIRKMVGLVVDVCRGTCSIDAISSAFSSNKVDVSMAPGVGLFLDELFFDGYNSKMKREIEISLKNNDKKKRKFSEVVNESELTVGKAVENEANESEGGMLNHDSSSDQKMMIDI